MTVPTYKLRLYVAGDRGPSRAAVQNLKKICDKELPGQYEIKVVDVCKHPRAVIENNLTALPIVVRTLPAPIRRFVGNWMNENHQLVGFGLITKDKPKTTKHRQASRNNKRSGHSKE
jgi:circadian clock protein KaiB